MWIPGQPARDSAEFARWLNGNLTRFCGHGMHDRCRGMINTIGIMASCLCKCHGRLPAHARYHCGGTCGYDIERHYARLAGVDSGTDDLSRSDAKVGP